jgi:hypothetical protein
MSDLGLLADTMEEWSTTSGDHHMLVAAVIRQLIKLQASLQHSGEPVVPEWVSATEWNKKIRDSTDKLLAEAGFEPDCSIRHGLAMMNFYSTPQPVVPEWVSVDERLPEAETPVLAIVDGYDGLLTVELRWERCDYDFLYWDWVDNDGQDLEGRVRFWMRLPEMPALLSAGKGGEE